jgi:prevent-host-death family protein
MDDIGSAEARKKWADLLREADHGNTTTITIHGKPRAAVVPFDDYGRPGRLIGFRSAETNLGQIVRWFGRHHRKRAGVFWGRIAERFGTGSTAACEICRHFGLDPTTGKPMVDGDP